MRVISFEQNADIVMGFMNQANVDDYWRAGNKRIIEGRKLSKKALERLIKNKVVK